LGQFGQALVAGGGGPLGNAMTYMMQQRAEQAHAGDKFGEWKQQYDYENAHPKASIAQPYRWERNDGSVMELGAQGPQVLYEDPNPKNFTMQAIDNGDGTKTLVPVPLGGASAPAANRPALGSIIDDPRKGGGVSNGTRPFPVSALDQATAQGESGNRDYSGGRPVTSPMGAKYAMQVMPGTARAPGFGLAPANPDNPGDMNRLGREYRAKMQQRYGGDLRKMWAAYNWGPGNLDKALAAHGENGWFAAAPQETRDYVARNLRNLGAR
jgi:hypothetical protein